MLVKIDTNSPHIIVLSQDDDKIGWAIILYNRNSILINPTNELRKLCRNDVVLKIDSKDKPCLDPICFGGLELYVGSYRKKKYVYFPKGKWLFPMGVPHHDLPKLINTLGVERIFTKDGKVKSSVEAYLESIVN